MGTISLYLERFFRYLESQNVMEPGQIAGSHIHDFLRYISGYSNQTKDHMMRTMRQFMEFCWQNQYHPQNLANFAPNIHYDKRAHIPSAYSYDEAMKVLSMVDRSNPVGKRNYAILLLITCLGLRTGDVSGLCFENFDWERNRLTLTQHKTGRPLTLPLLEENVPLPVISEILGHATTETTAVYLTISIDQLRRCALEV